MNCLQKKKKKVYFDIECKGIILVLLLQKITLILLIYFKLIVVVSSNKLLKKNIYLFSINLDNNSLI